MILRDSFKFDLVERLKDASESAFASRGTTREAVLADDELIENLWSHYQKSIEEYDVDEDYAFTDALDECIGVPKRSGANTLAPDGDPITDRSADGSISLDADAAGQAISILCNSIGSADLLKDIIKDGRLQKSDVRTHLTLMRHTFEDLSEMLDSGETLNAELAQRTAMLREANGEIKRLKDEMGRGVRCGALSGALRKYEQIFRAWYEHLGFHYASIEFGVWGLMAEISEEMTLDQSEPHLSEKELYGKMSFVKPGTFTTADESYHRNLLDTDANKKAMAKAVAKWLPGARISDFRSFSDRKDFLLRTKVIVPYEALDVLWDRCQKGGKTK